MSTLAAAQERQEIKTERAEAKAAKQTSRTEKAEKPGASKRLTDRLLTLIELGGVGLIVYLLRKPLEKFSFKVAFDIYKGLHVIEDGLKDVAVGIEDAEKRIRADIVASWMQDPILMHKLGPGLYRELVINSAWPTTIYSPDGSYPGEVSDLFLAGTGRGATQLRGAITHGVSIQILALSKWFIGNSANLQSVGRFPQTVGGQ